MNTPGQIFFSYSRDDRDVALRLAGILRSRGVNLWVDRLDIAPGEPFRQAIDAALDECSTLLVVLTNSSAASQEVETEWNSALAEGKQVIPVVVEACRIPRRLAVLQYTDLSRHDVNEFERLVAALGGRAEANAPAVEELPPAGVPRVAGRAGRNRGVGLLAGAIIGALYGAIAAFLVYWNDVRDVLPEATASYAAVAAIAGAIAGVITGKDLKALLLIAGTVAVVGILWVVIWGTYADVVITGLVLGGGFAAIIVSIIWTVVVRRRR